jgi:hypothetical protein
VVEGKRKRSIPGALCVVDVKEGPELEIKEQTKKKLIQKNKY